MTESNRSLFINQGNLTLRLFIPILASFQTCLRFLPCPPYLQVSGTSYQNLVFISKTYFNKDTHPRLNLVHFPYSPQRILWIVLYDSVLLRTSTSNYPVNKSARKHTDFTGTSEIPLLSRWRGREAGLCVKSVVSILVKISFTYKN